VRAREKLPGSILIQVIGVKRLGEYRLEIEFSDGTVGTRDFAFMVVRSGPMLEPLRDPGYFARVFIEEGVLTWPNGYDYDSIALHDEMKGEGLLHRGATAE
jgi:uncharacterized protein DUF2442